MSELHLTNTSDLLKVKYPSSKLIICGNINEIDTIDLQNYLNLLQLMNFPTYGNKTLGLIFSDLHDYYHPPLPLAPFGRTGATVLYKSLRNKVTTEIKYAKFYFYPQILQNFKLTDQSKWFNKIKKSLWSKQGAAHSTLPQQPVQPRCS